MQQLVQRLVIRLQAVLIRSVRILRLVGEVAQPWGSGYRKDVKEESLFPTTWREPICSSENRAESQQRGEEALRILGVEPWF